MTQEEAANELLSMYAMYRQHYDDGKGTYRQAVTLAIDALAAAAHRDACAECREDDPLRAILEEIKAIRAAMPAAPATDKGEAAT